MDDYPDTLIPIELHVGDDYHTNWALSRYSFYSGSGTPTAWFDGVRSCVGANTNVTAMYNWYKDQYDARRAIPTDVTIQLDAFFIAAWDCRVQVEVAIEPTGQAKTMRVHLVQLIDNWPGDPWYSRNTFRQAATTETVTLYPGESAFFERTFTFDTQSWFNYSQIRLVAWAQATNSSAPAEVYNAAILSAPFEYLTGDLDCDGDVDFDDINPFVLALGGQAGYEAIYPDCQWLNADCDDDGDVDFDDINPFVALLGG